MIARIEHEDGYGIYYGGVNRKIDSIAYDSEFKDLVHRHNYSHDSLPLPTEDGIPLLSSDYFYAFKDLDTLLKWVTVSEIKALHARGFKILLLTVVGQYTGEHQVGYKKENIQDSTDITQLFLKQTT